MSCETCGSTEQVFLNHLENHLTPPRKIDICRACHTGLHVKNYRRRSGKHPSNMRAVNSRKQGKYTYYQIAPPKGWVEKYCPTLEVTTILIDNCIIGIPGDRDDLLYSILPALPKVHKILTSGSDFSDIDVKEALELNPEIIPIAKKLIEENNTLMEVA